MLRDFLEDGRGKLRRKRYMTLPRDKIDLRDPLIFSGWGLALFIDSVHALKRVKSLELIIIVL